MNKRFQKTKLFPKYVNQQKKQINSKNMPRKALHSVKDLIFAKLGQHPWWPAKIISHRIQKSQHIYEIFFFGEKSFCFVKQEDVVAFSLFKQEWNLPYPKTKILTKAFKEANQYFPSKVDLVKILQPIQPKTSKEKREKEFQQKKSQQHFQKSQKIIQEEVLCRKEQEELIVAQIEQLNQVDSPSNDIDQITEITFENVISKIEKSRKNNQKSYNYQQRKQKIHYQYLLKKKLLEKYQLGKLKGDSTMVEDQILETTIIPKIKNKQISKRRNKWSDIKAENLKKICVKKIYEVVRRHSTESILTTKMAAINLFDRMVSVSQNNISKLKSLFLLFIKSDGTGILEFNIYLDKIQGQKQWDEQGSKMTQISVNAEV